MKTYIRNLNNCDCHPEAYWMYLGNVKIGLKRKEEVMRKYGCSMCHKLIYIQEEDNENKNFKR